MYLSGQRNLLYHVSFRANCSCRGSNAAVAFCALFHSGFMSETLKRLTKLNASTAASSARRSPKGMRLETRMSVKTSLGLVPALRLRFPSRVPLRKHAGCRKPVGENLDAARALPHGSVGVLAGTIVGRSVGVLKSKLVSVPEIILNGLPETASIIGASVQPERNFSTNPPPPSLPV